MSVDKITKGPWKTHLGIAGPTFIYVGDHETCEEEGRIVCEVFPTEGVIDAAAYLFDMEKSYDNMAANADLISAAPEMYDALKEACYEMCVRCSGEELCKPCSSLSEDRLHCNAEPGKCFVQRWLNVLAKARGEEMP